MDRVEDLEKRVRELEDKFLTLVSCVQFLPERAFEAKLVQLDISGDRRVALGLVLSALLQRARGVAPSRPAYLPGVTADAADVYSPGPVTRSEAVELLARVFGLSRGVAEEVLVAHRDSGFGADGHRALGT